MARERDYISNAEYDEALRKFYNGFDNFTDHIEYKESIAEKFKFDPRLIEAFIEEEEEYAVLDRGYCITNYGRVFNLKFRRFLKPKFYNSNIYIYCGGGQYRMEPTFKEMGWEFDKPIILKRYIDNRWPMKLMPNCKYCGFVENDYLLLQDI